jgi:hypothetical protein
LQTSVEGNDRFKRFDVNNKLLSFNPEFDSLSSKVIVLSFFLEEDRVLDKGDERPG